MSSDQKAKTVRYCAAAYCDGTEHLQSFPSDPIVKDKWIRFLKVHQKNIKITSNSRLCFRHFKPKDFTNYGHYKMMKDEIVR